MSTSTFHRSVSKVYGIAAGQPVLEWVRTNCSFAFVEIPDPDLCSAVEAATVRLLRLNHRRNFPLLGGITRVLHLH